MTLGVVDTYAGGRDPDCGGLVMASILSKNKANEDAERPAQ